ncbi:Uma2 family endonuclease [Actinomadura craniellae]|uniref:Uma2 family endonuclease n=1 Tax=Actinomadura craniellae TaxID=2231787 RepID=A0A365H5B5_9ACTN|nr:Uma2 family endonuclease [Actinomadura craniellae]RAY14281.1 Uma2 family endonuclease [Actinomadura craniellae]
MTAFPDWMLALPEEGLTAEEYDRMPAEQCRNIEIVDGKIIVSPSATPRHNIIIREIANALTAAVTSPWHVTSDVDLRIADVPLLNRRPDVLVFQGDLDELPVRPHQVLLAVEVMSKGSVTTDRIDKPAEYASVKIPHYWRLERDGDELVAYTYAHDSTKGAYIPSGTYRGRLKTDRPLSVDIDLDILLR